MSKTVRVLCSAHCIHNDGTGYYNICNHPKAQNILPYGGIDRLYTGDCELKEKPAPVRKEQI